MSVLARLRAAGRFKIEQIPCPHPSGKVSLGAPRKIILHTTEGGWDSALGVFKQHFAPHFLVGPGRIAQLVPVGYMAAALENHAGGVETNSLALIQIEIVGKSSAHPWLPDKPTLDALTSLLATLSKQYNIPLVRVPNPARDPGRWLAAQGVMGHADVPENSHWDPGNLVYSTVLLHAQTELNAMKPKPPKVVLGDVLYAWVGWRVLGKTGKRPAGVPLKIPAAWWAEFKKRK